MPPVLEVTQVQPDLDWRIPTEEELREMSPAVRLMYASALAVAAERGLLPDGTRLATLIGPKTDDELLDAVEELTGYHIPRVAVCIEHNHTSPAQTFCDLYFERITDCLWIGNRGGGKTTNSGFLHGAKGRWLPGYTSAIAGAVSRQGYRAYAEFKRFIRQVGDEIVDTLLSKTTWTNSSETEVLGGTVAALNGPHPNLAQFDEVELTTPEPFEEFLNMAQGNATYAGQQLLTSTRKRAFGIVQGIVAQVQKSLKEGETPAWEVRIFCVFETMANVPSCRMAPENEGKPDSELCNCHRIKKGTWDNGRDRTFADVCGGRAFRSDGFVHLKDVQKRFMQLSRYTWEAQQECLQPDIEGQVHKWLRDKHYLPKWLPLSMFGPIYRGWDWGGVNPNAVVWCQLLAVDVGIDEDGTPILDEETEPFKVLKAGSLIQFDEVYKTSDELPGDGGFSDLGHYVALREVQWRSIPMFSDLVIAGDFCDPAGFVAKREVKKAFRLLIETGDYPDLQIPNFKSIAAPVHESVRLHISWGESDNIYIVAGMCPGADNEYQVYHWPDKRDGKNPSEEPVKEDDHAMDAVRYLIWNLTRLTDRTGGRETPGADDRKPETPGPGNRGPFAPPHTEPSGSPVGAVGDGPLGYLGRSPHSPGRVREAPTPGVRQLAGGGRVR